MSRRVWHRYVLKSFIPDAVLHELHEFGWYRRLVGGHWERRVIESPSMPGLLVESQAQWLPTGDLCWAEAELFDGTHGIHIGACEDHGPEAVVSRSGHP